MMIAAVAREEEGGSTPGTCGFWVKIRIKSWARKKGDEKKLYSICSFAVWRAISLSLVNSRHFISDE